MAVVCLASVSCTSPYPNAIPEPENDDSIKIEYNKYTSKSDNKYMMAANQVKIYELQLRQKEQKLATQKYSLNDISAVGAVTSVIAAASGALTTALYAGGVSVVGGAAGQRYNYDVQLLNYRTTRQKLNCIYRSMTDITTQQLAVAMNDNNAPSVIGVLKPYLNSVTSDLIFELESEQAAVNLVAPDLNSIAATVNERNSAKNKLESPQVNFDSSNPVAVLALAELIRTNIKMCKSSPATAPVVAVLAANTGQSGSAATTVGK
ncbi:MULTISPECIES: hypothetical protein [unclassified Pantoea]|uniref:hypothetical protein n=1 Tax=unclassified Pantoea TaxID=2630326 RepID=UPI001CD6D5CA|nr:MULTISPECIES: hypothetical protein [unclassified Pantoea]MCA1179735.1 hypothetical protein [Pantoea sp. alder69]MCA1252330.1 hypothetical protein [Pantoea sp. alder70]MCA1268078.1 hypothetical protein [Pantoea sp. alder81]